MEEFEITEELYDRLNRSLRNLPEGASPAERLAAICKSICDAEAALLGRQGDDPNKGAVDTVFSAFLSSLERETQQGLICFAETSGEENASLDYEDLKVDIEARKMGLRSRLQALRSVRLSINSVLRVILTAQMLKKKDETKESHSLPFCCLQEKDEWESLLAKVDEMKTSPIPSEEATESELASTSVTLYAAEELDALQRMESEVLQRLTMQVDGVCTLLGNVEDLLLRANDVAQEAQRHQHSRRFKAFQHMNSPARLIKAIVQAPVSGFE